MSEDPVLYATDGTALSFKLIGGVSAAHTKYDRTFLIEKLVRPGTLTLVQGPPNSKKTWFLLEAMRAIAAGTPLDKESLLGRTFGAPKRPQLRAVGRPFLGKFGTKQGACLALLHDSPAEDSMVQWRRVIQAEDKQMAIAWENSVGDGEIGSGRVSVFEDLVKFFWTDTHRLNFANRDTVDKFIALVRGIKHVTPTLTGPPPIEAYFAKFGPDAEDKFIEDCERDSRVGVQHIFFDSLSKMHAADENDNMQMEAVMSSFVRIARDTRAAVWLAHHFAKPPQDARGTSIYSGRGASRVADIADNIFNLTPDTDPLKSIVEVKKIRGTPVTPFCIELSVFRMMGPLPGQFCRTIPPL